MIMENVVTKERLVQTQPEGATSTPVEEPPSGAVVALPINETQSIVIKQRKKVIILGFAPDTRNMAPVDDPTFDVWPLNELYLEMPILREYATGWFQLHGSEPSTIRDPQQKLSLSKLKCPIWMWNVHPEIPNSVKYPREQIMKHFDTYGEGMNPLILHERDRVYFTNTISWMIVLAIYLQYEEIHIYGVNMAQDQEYQHQRPSCEMYIGWARGRGIKVHLPHESDLCRSWMLYGYDDDSAYMKKMYAREGELQQRINAGQQQIAQFQQQIANLSAQQNQLMGAKENVKYCIGLGAPGGTSDLFREEVKQEVKDKIEAEALREKQEAARKAEIEGKE